MDELLAKVEAILAEYEAGSALDLLDSGRWTEVRQEVKELATDLELKGAPGAAVRVDREYRAFADQLRAAAAEDTPPRIREDRVLYDVSQEFVLTLRALCKHQSQFRSLPKRNSTRRRGSRRGRPGASAKQVEKRMAILDRWDRAKDAGVPRARFCVDEGIEVKDLERIQDWARQRANRGQG